jgi:hypothetical protein
VQLGVKPTLHMGSSISPKHVGVVVVAVYVVMVVMLMVVVVVLEMVVVEAVVLDVVVLVTVEVEVCVVGRSPYAQFHNPYSEQMLFSQSRHGPLVPNVQISSLQGTAVTAVEVPVDVTVVV